jgi:hypothetical protein
MQSVASLHRQPQGAARASRRKRCVAWPLFTAQDGRTTESLTRVDVPAAPDLWHVQGGHRGPGPEAGGQGERGYRLRNNRRPEQEEVDVLHRPEKRRRQGGRGEGQEGKTPLRCS